MHIKHLACAALLSLASAIPAAAATFQGERSDFRDETIYFDNKAN